MVAQRALAVKLWDLGATFTDMGFGRAEAPSQCHSDWWAVTSRPGRVGDLGHYLDAWVNPNSPDALLPGLLGCFILALVVTPGDTLRPACLKEFDKCWPHSTGRVNKLMFAKGLTFLGERCCISTSVLIIVLMPPETKSGRITMNKLLASDPQSSTI